MGNAEAMDRRTIRNVIRWLRAEGAISAWVSTSRGGVLVYRNKKIQRACERNGRR
jgi:hypothetical protein